MLFMFIRGIIVDMWPLILTQFFCDETGFLFIFVFLITGKESNSLNAARTHTTTTS
jgi:hypothetical protein